MRSLSCLCSMHQHACNTQRPVHQTPAIGTARRRNLEYLDLDYFAILPEDYGGTSDRPQCEKGPSDQHYVSQVQACIVLDCAG